MERAFLIQWNIENTIIITRMSKLDFGIKQPVSS